MTPRWFLLNSCLILFTYTLVAHKPGRSSNMQAHLQEHKMLLNRLFKKIDTNNDNFLDKAELLRVANHMDTLQLQDNVEHEFDSLDHNMDDLISIDECIHNHFDRKLTEEDAERILNGKYTKSETEFWIQRTIGKFRQADQDKDGYLSHNELKYYLHPEAYIEMKELLINETLQDHDKNANGLIEIEEFNSRGPESSLFDESVRPPNSADGIDMFNGPLDKDGDGTLDREEIWKWISMLESKYHLQEVEHMLSQVDDNRDGKISFEEVKKHDYKIMDSPITGHGRLYKDEL
ncbi:hypothetical protein LOD99_9601 [Oopsacas minuta]|uniref:EF-hand domain-containing protein n=1 Tax=Oopsacas minuta TaxID=111878 RepID=A0AAV7KT66_9METZ|nr:hypothetical protein LOD99_9601 [Oopsacas minuta]